MAEIKIIVAYAKIKTTPMRLIGRGNGIPWHLPGDLLHFKRTTQGAPVIMGRKTYDSLPKSVRPLPGRVNIVITRNRKWKRKGVLVFHTLAQALVHVHAMADVKTAFIIGGGEIYRAAMAFADEIIASEVHGDYWVSRGDTLFPAIDHEEWVVQSTTHDDGFDVVRYVRRQP